MRRRSMRGAGAESGAPSDDQPTTSSSAVVPVRRTRSSSSGGGGGTRSSARKRGRAAEEEEEAEVANEDEANVGNGSAAAPQEDNHETHKRAKAETTASSSSAAAAASSEPAASPAPSSSASPAPSPPPGDGDDDADDADGRDGADEPEDAEALAAAAGLSMYEWQRQQNIRIKLQQMQQLNLHTMSSDIGIRRAPPVRSSSSKKANKPPAVGVRRSARAIGAPPDRYVPELHTEASSGWTRPERVDGPISLADAIEGDADKADTAQYEAVLASLRGALRLSDEDTATKARQAVQDSYGQPRPVSQTNVRMLGEGVKVIKTRATCLQYHPTVSLSEPVSVLAVGDKNGLVSCVRFSNRSTQSAWASTVQTAKYAPQVGSIVELQWGGGEEGHALYSASRDGSVRRLDVAAEMFDQIWVADGDDLSAMCMSPSRSSVYVGDRGGFLHQVDTRASSGASSSRRSASTKIQLSTHAINGMSINPMDGNMLASAGKDRTVRVWDLRHTAKALKSWDHSYSVNSVYFSPTGNMMASTSYDDTVKLFSCVNSGGELLSPEVWSPPLILKHNNHTGRWVSVFRSVFAPLDVALAIGNMNRPIDVWTFPNGIGLAGKTDTPAASAAAASSSPPAAAAASSSSSQKKKKQGANGNDASFSTAGPGLPPPNPAPLLSFTHGEWVTSIPAAIAWHPTRVQIAGCTGSGRLYVYGSADK